MKNTFKHLLTTSILILLFIKLPAQETFNYQITRNEPYRVKLVTQLNLINLNCGFFNPFELGAGVAADYYFPKPFSLHFAYNFSYWGVTTTDLGNTNWDNNKIKKYKELEIGGRFNIVDKEGKKRMKIVLNIVDAGQGYNLDGSSRAVNVTSARIEFPTRQIVALRGGLYQSTLPVSSEWNKANEPKSANSSGSVIDNGGGLKATNGVIIGNPFTDFTNMHAFGFYAGISSMYIINASWSQDGTYSGRFYKLWLSELYFDIIYVPSFSFDDIIIGSSNYTIKPNADGSFLMQSLGWRIGFNRLSPKPGGLTTNLEAGMRPGIKGYTLYFGCGMGFTIDSRAKDKVTKKQ